MEADRTLDKTYSSETKITSLKVLFYEYRNQLTKVVSPT